MYIISLFNVYKVIEISDDDSDEVFDVKEEQSQSITVK